MKNKVIFVFTCENDLWGEKRPFIFGKGSQIASAARSSPVDGRDTAFFAMGRYSALFSYHGVGKQTF